MPGKTLSGGEPTVLCCGRRRPAIHEFPCTSQQAMDGRPSPAKAQMVRRRLYPDAYGAKPGHSTNLHDSFRASVTMGHGVDGAWPHCGTTAIAFLESRARASPAPSPRNSVTHRDTRSEPPRQMFSCRDGPRCRRHRSRAAGRPARRGTTHQYNRPRISQTDPGREGARA